MKLSLRDILSSILVVGLILGWQLDRQSLAVKIAAARQSEAKLSARLKLADAKVADVLERHIKLLQDVQQLGVGLEEDADGGSRIRHPLLSLGEPSDR